MLWLGVSTKTSELGRGQAGHPTSTRRSWAELAGRGGEGLLQVGDAGGDRGPPVVAVAGLVEANGAVARPSR